MTLLWFMLIPGVACLLVLVAAFDQVTLWAARRGRIRWRRLDRPRTASAAGLGAFDAALSEGGRLDQDERQSRLLLRNEHADSDPPRIRVDLDRGTATVHADPCPAGDTVETVTCETDD